MIIKQYILEQNPKAFLDYKIFLLYGENEGFKKEFKDWFHHEQNGIHW